MKYAIEKVAKTLQRLYDQYNDASSDIAIDHSATDSDGAILTNEDGSFKYTKEGLKEKHKAMKELNSREFDIASYYILNGFGFGCSNNCETI